MKQEGRAGGSEGGRKEGSGGMEGGSKRGRRVAAWHGVTGNQLTVR